MKQLMIMRHAKSSWKDPSISDHDRPLNPRGIDNAPRMGRFAAGKACLPQLILASTARRAVGTAELFVEGCEQEIPITRQRGLYHPGIEDYCEAVGTQGSDQSRIMVVSHNPGSEEWTWRLTGCYETLPTAAIAIVRFDDDFHWADLNRRCRGELVEVWRPKEVL